METLLAVLMKDAQAAKFGPIRSACQNAIGNEQNLQTLIEISDFIWRESPTSCLQYEDWSSELQ